jgi:hypothetical protein
MKIELHIERLVLEGMPVRERDRARIGAAVETELARLFRLPGGGNGWGAGGAVASVKAGAIRVEAATGPQRLGRQIARSVYGSMRGDR